MFTGFIRAESYGSWILTSYDTSSTKILMSVRVTGTTWTYVQYGGTATDF